LHPDRLAPALNKTLVFGNTTPNLNLDRLRQELLWLPADPLAPGC
jgi:hypothetical protein